MPLEAFEGCRSDSFRLSNAMSTATIRAGTLGATLLAALLLFWFHSGSVFPLFQWPLPSFQEAQYVERRDNESAKGFPIRTVEAGVNARLPAEIPITLGVELRNDPMLSQRLGERLYPRRLASNSEHVLDYGKLDEQSVSLATWRGRQIVLRGPTTQRPIAAPATSPDYPLDFSWWRLAACVLGMLGWGMAIAFWARPPGSPAIRVAGLGTSTVYAAAFIGTLASLATWLQIPVPLGIVSLLGLAAAAWTLRSRERACRWLGDIIQPLRHWETWLLLTVGVPFFLYIARTPVTGWDGRSIWLFHAKQIFTEGCLARIDRWNPEYEFAHPHYPLLVPAWLAQCSSLEPQYNERMANLGIPVLCMGVVGAIWSAGRKALGRWPGAMLTLALLFALSDSMASGYVDAFVSLFLVLLILSLTNTNEPLALAAALAASLVKREGLPLAFAVVVLYLITHPWARTRDIKARALRLAVFLPAVGHQIWSHYANFPDAYAANAVFSLGRIVERLPIVLSAATRLNSSSLYIMVGSLGVALSLVAMARGQWSWGGMAAVTLSAGFFGFVAYTMLVTPYDLGWHIATALDRLLIHPATMGILAPFLFLEHPSPVQLGRRVI